MGASNLAWLSEHYQWLLAIYAGVGIVAANVIYTQLTMLVPTIREAHQHNKATFQSKMERPAYAGNHAWNRKWAPLYMIAIFALVLPFCLTLEAQPWWKMGLDVVVILMVYDFFYYLMHRYLFHDNNFIGGPLKWMHAVHHRQHDPCRMDSSYIHPLEVACGLGLYTATILALSWPMGRFHVATIIITWVAFSRINVHNHALWKSDRFPFKYMNYAARMHHNHHAKFTGGNYATITLLFDWMFGTLDDGNGWGKHARVGGTKRESALADFR
jgi:sterol desaturase/sphingolipid hydroxylase (fatty acid hydroxylase superfamily)